MTNGVWPFFSHELSKILENKGPNRWIFNLHNQDCCTECENVARFKFILGKQHSFSESFWAAVSLNCINLQQFDFDASTTGTD